MRDLALWDENFYTARVGGRALIDKLQERGSLNDGSPLNYAAGLVIGKYRGLNVVAHAGSDAGYRADLIRFPDQHFSAAVLCNLASTNPSLLARRIADIYLAPALAPVNPPARRAVAAARPGATGEMDRDCMSNPRRAIGCCASACRTANCRAVLRPMAGPLASRPRRMSAFAMCREPQTELVFSGGENGAPATLKTYTDGKLQHSYSRATPFEPSTAQLEEYAGIYRSDEVDMPREIVVRDGKLVVRSLKSREITLLPVSVDLFNGGGNRIRFLRDAQGKVTGASLSTFRVFNFRFTRAQ